MKGGKTTQSTALREGGGRNTYTGRKEGRQSGGAHTGNKKLETARPKAPRKAEKAGNHTCTTTVTRTELIKYVDKMPT